ncbi:Inhibitor of apoptosis-promoting Bax1-related protein [Lasiodiplodia theobromae]|uniref:Protein lifeguard 4 n=1 Tax=Lasiodiplodia theobromae TaxID=45133 RepID=A0A5N5DLW8_9PEZI|nr:Inhibitor of apoptosis-promoting Bax1-related protein [Lasiodiplodia theobromae]KAB2578580.1 Protein lifeguard 4 [Lasiodiplodia theobromae]KAF4542608.1 Inhibitor of apoptosis-promoting Bax1-related protein [Lasiodiplodia theobromae]KAF9640725.1 Inhibitor of apoptosis-promoting Bax1-related protein [Lasiodiplodia theobromae]
MSHNQNYDTMAANTKYQPAPQRDSFEDEQSAGFSQAPPAYEAEAATNAALLSGVARGEYDNVPDDFKFGGVVAEATLDIRMQFIRKVYAILTVQLLMTAVLSSISFFSEGYRHWIQGNQWMMWISLFGAIGFMLLTFWKRKSYPTNLLFLTGFTVLESYSISVITSYYEATIVLEALIFTLAIFVALTAFACQSKYDFTSWMPYLFGAIWVLIIFGFMSAFFPYNSKVELGYGIVAALIFSGYILVDTQLIMRHYHVEEEIAAAMSLYLDILNLFLAILRILNSQNNN